MYKVLLVEEKRAVVNEFCRVLEPNNVSCIRIHSAEEALQIVHNEWIDLVILDILSPTLLWIQVCEKIRECSVVPIIIMTETYEKIFILQALDAGADDVVTKCMDIDILMAKTKAHLRRGSSSNPKELHFKGIVLNRELLEIQYEGNLLPFTQKEYALIEYFLNHPNQVIKRKKLLSHLWDGYQHIDARTVDSHIRNIRMKFREVGFPIDEFLRTARGIGYLWKMKLEDSDQKLTECQLKEKLNIDHKLMKLYKLN